MRPQLHAPELEMSLTGGEHRRQQHKALETCWNFLLVSSKTSKIAMCHGMLWDGQEPFGRATSVENAPGATRQSLECEPSKPGCVPSSIAGLAGPGLRCSWCSDDHPHPPVNPPGSGTGNSSVPLCPKSLGLKMAGMDLMVG